MAALEPDPDPEPAEELLLAEVVVVVVVVVVVGQGPSAHTQRPALHFNRVKEFKSTRRGNNIHLLLLPLDHIAVRYFLFNYFFAFILSLLTGAQWARTLGARGSAQEGMGGVLLV